MAITVTPNLTVIHDCENATGWDNGSTQDVYVRQGTYALGMKVSQTTSPVAKYDLGAGGVNMTGKHVYVWMQVGGLPDTKANGGYRIYVEDTSGNNGTWYVGGSDTASGWSRFVIDPASTPTTGSGTINPSSIRYVGVQFKVLSKSIGNASNAFWDILHYGTGLTITSGPADAISFENIFSADDTNAYGVLTKANGTYIIQGKLIFGSNTSGDIDFTDTNQLVLFPANAFVSDTFYGIEVLANAGGTTNFQLGNKSGASGIQGCILKAVGTKTFSFNATDTDIDTLKLYGTTFLNAGTISLPPYAVGREVLNCLFDSCAEILSDTCVVEDSTIVSADDRGIRMSSISHNIASCNFISCGHGVHIPNAGTYTFDNLQFSGNSFDIENSSTGSVTVNATGGSNPSTVDNTGGGSTTINNAVTLKVSVVDSNNNPINLAQVAIYRLSDDVELMNQDTNTSGVATSTYNYLTDTDVYVRVRKSSTGTQRYFNASTTGTITSSGLDVKVTLRQDDIVAA